MKRYYLFDGETKSVQVVENGTIVKRWASTYQYDAIKVESMSWVGELWETYMLARKENLTDNLVREISEEEAFGLVL